MQVTLRRKLIEAGTDAIIDDRGMGDVVIGSDEWVMVWEDAEIALDAFLGVLETHADEWATTNIELWGDVDNLLAVLREPSE